MQVQDVSRRGLFVAGALAAGAAALLPAQAQAAPTAQEQANLKLVEDFCRTWGAASFDPDQVMPAYIAADGRVRVMEDAPVVVGPQAVADAFKPYLKNGERFRVKMLSTLARGPVVVTHRMDTMVTPGKPDHDVEVVGLFLVKQGKIQEWTDYVVT